jgi:hypothetical protein
MKMNGIKNLLALVVLTGIITSCSKNEEEGQLLSKWKLIEQLADPGDGSGVFTPVDSDKTIEFLCNDDVVSNGPLCTMSTETGSVGKGKYDASAKIIVPDNCNSPEYQIAYSINDSVLILYYPCIEGCGQKFRLIEGAVRP